MLSREALARRWCHPTLLDESGDVAASPSATCPSPQPRKLQLQGLFPYWLVPGSDEAVVPNDVAVAGMVVLTGPNGGGKSSLLRGMCVAALLATCGLMVPAHQATVPRYDAIMLRMMATDSPSDNKSSFQMEMRELSTILSEVSPSTFVLIDELCRGTEVDKGTCLVAATLEQLAARGCMGFLSTHLHRLVDVEKQLQLEGVVRKKMGVAVNKEGQLHPTWQLEEGTCMESLAFQMAERERVDPALIRRAEDLHSILKHTWHPSIGRELVAKVQVEVLPTIEIEAEINAAVRTNTIATECNKAHQVSSPPSLSASSIDPPVSSAEDGELQEEPREEDRRIFNIHLLAEILDGYDDDYLPDGTNLRVWELPSSMIPSIKTSMSSCVYVAKTLKWLYVGQVSGKGIP